MKLVTEISAQCSTRIQTSTDVILMCFFMDRTGLQQNSLDFWVPEIEVLCLTVPITPVVAKIELKY